MATGSKKPAARRRRPAATGSVTEKLRIDFVIISDSAQEVGGKLYMMGGGWDIYRAKSYPAAVQFGLGIGILVPWNATNERHTLTFIIRSADGEPVLPSMPPIQTSDCSDVCIRGDDGVWRYVSRRLQTVFAGATPVTIPPPGAV